MYSRSPIPYVVEKIIRYAKQRLGALPIMCKRTPLFVRKYIWLHFDNKTAIKALNNTDVESGEKADELASIIIAECQKPFSAFIFGLN